MSQQIVFEGIAQLVKEGKTPTTALIKSRLPQPLPMTMILQALTAWRRNPQLAKPDAGTPATTTAASAPTLESLQQRIEQLEQQIALLNQKVSGLGH